MNPELTRLLTEEELKKLRDEAAKLQQEAQKTTIGNTLPTQIINPAQHQKTVHQQKQAETKPDPVPSVLQQEVPQEIAPIQKQPDTQVLPQEQPMQSSEEQMIEPSRTDMPDQNQPVAETEQQDAMIQTENAETNLSMQQTSEAESMPENEVHEATERTEQSSSEQQSNQIPQERSIVPYKPKEIVPHQTKNKVTIDAFQNNILNAAQIENSLMQSSEKVSIITLDESMQSTVPNIPEIVIPESQPSENQYIAQPEQLPAPAVSATEMTAPWQTPVEQQNQDIIEPTQLVPELPPLPSKASRVAQSIEPISTPKKPEMISQPQSRVEQAQPQPLQNQQIAGAAAPLASGLGASGQTNQPPVLSPKQSEEHATKKPEKQKKKNSGSLLSDLFFILGIGLILGFGLLIAFFTFVQEPPEGTIFYDIRAFLEETVL